MIRAARLIAAIIAEVVWLTILSAILGLLVSIALLDHLSGDDR